MSEWIEAPKLEFPSYVDVKKSGHGTDLVGGYHMPNLTRYCATVSQPTAYSFRFDEGWNWAIFTINDRTGEFVLQSDWGSWSYRWNLSSLGKDSFEHVKPLSHFLARNNDADYVARKLCSPDEQNQYDGKGTQAALKRSIIEKRWERDISAVDARTFWDEVDQLDIDHVESLFDSLKATSLGTFLNGHDVYEEFVQHRPSVAWHILCYKLLPFFFDYLRREVIAPAKRAVTDPDDPGYVEPAF